MYIKKLLKPTYRKMIELSISAKCYNSSNLSKIEQHKNKFKNKRCFIIGNGPSLRVEDLEKLDSEVTMASNSMYILFDKTNWRPSYYFCQDPVMLTKIIKNIRKIKCTKFIGSTGKFKHTDKNAAYYKIDSENYYNGDKPKFSDDVSNIVYDGFTVTYSMLQFAMYMGFEEIYLLGIDFNYIINDKNQIDKESYPDERMATNVGGNPDIEYNLSAYEEANRYANEHGVKIYNATRGGKLEVFDRVNFDELIYGK